MSLQQPDGREPKAAQQPPPRKRGGRNGAEKVYTEDIAAEILDRLAEGESLAAICRDAHMPSEKAVRLWARDRTEVGVDGAPAFAPRYARARAVGYERLADEVIEISDAPCMGPDGFADNGLVQKQRLQADSRKWLLSKLLPQQFGDKVTQELVGNADQPLVTRIELVAVDPRPALLPRARIIDSDDVEG
jgi:hypothetical protein